MPCLLQVNHALYNNSDTAYGAAFLAKVVPSIAPLLKLLSYWTFTDNAFAETGQLETPFHNGYGVMLVCDAMHFGTRYVWPLPCARVMGCCGGARADICMAQREFTERPRAASGVAAFM